MIEDLAARIGAEVIRSSVGEANVVDAMLSNDAVIGGEGTAAPLTRALSLVAIAKSVWL